MQKIVPYKQANSSYHDFGYDIKSWSYCDPEDGEHGFSTGEGIMHD